MENVNSNSVSVNNTVANNNDQIVINGKIKLTFETDGLDVKMERAHKRFGTSNGVNDEDLTSSRTQHVEPTKSSITLEFDETAIGYCGLINAIGGMIGNL